MARTSRAEPVRPVRRCFGGSCTGLAGTLALGSALVIGGGAAVAQERCSLGGTFLTLKNHDGAVDPGVVGRTILSFLPGENMVMVDAAQGGIEGFQPFTDARGAWTCAPSAAGGEAFRAVLIDFTMPTAAEPDPKIARVELEGEHARGTLTGRATVSFYPISGDPTDKTAGENVIHYDFSGVRISLGPTP